MGLLGSLFKEIGRQIKKDFEDGTLNRRMLETLKKERDKAYREGDWEKASKLDETIQKHDIY